MTPFPMTFPLPSKDDGINDEEEVEAMEDGRRPLLCPAPTSLLLLLLLLMVVDRINPSRI